jgi:hypothetical protein
MATIDEQAGQAAEGRARRQALLNALSELDHETERSNMDNALKGWENANQEGEIVKAKAAFLFPQVGTPTHLEPLLAGKRLPVPTQRAPGGMHRREPASGFCLMSV